MMTFLLILLFVAISFFDYRKMLKAKKKKVIVIYTAILGIAFVISELHILEIKVVGLNQLVSSVINFLKFNNSGLYL